MTVKLQAVNVICNAMETAFFRRNYILKVWVSTILGAPILMMFLTTIIMSKQGNKFDNGGFGFITFSVGYGLLLSIPTFLISYFLFNQLCKWFQRSFHLKLSLIVIGVVCILFTFFLLYGTDEYNLKANYAALTFSIAYTFCLTIFGLIFPIKTQKHSV